MATAKGVNLAGGYRVTTSGSGISVRGVWKFYGKFEALKGVDCTVEKGSIYGTLFYTHTQY